MKTWPRPSSSTSRPAFDRVCRRRCTDIVMLALRAVLVIVVVALLWVPVVEFASAAAIAYHPTVQHKCSAVHGWRTTLVADETCPLPGPTPSAMVLKADEPGRLVLLTNPPFVPPRA